MARFPLAAAAIAAAAAVAAPAAAAFASTSSPFAVRTSSRFSSSSPPLTATLKPYIQTLIDGEHLTSAEAESAFDEILSGADEVQVGSLLSLLRARGETPDELAGMVRAMNKACNAVDLGDRRLLDIVGTGGDGADTINISTASVVLAAACGCTVAKAGNRSVSSRCGSADVLEALGVQVDLNPEQVVQCVEKCGVAFMYAPVNHPAMKYVAPVRKKLGVRTCFNILGPMTNAAGAQRAVIGVFHEGLAPLMAGALRAVGRVDHAVVIHGVGLDEISPLGPATIIEIKNTAPEGEERVYEETTYEFDPLGVGVPRCVVEDLRGGGPEENAEEFRKVLLGGEERNAKRDAVILNAGVGCYVYGLADSIEKGCEMARETLESGAATEVLSRWIEASQEVAAKSKAAAV
eukprot:CAMPEP_0183294488 /NCGR_PEP_ID=MMETSP0160_2-20130417/2811_1 /TAXON_ID=2839 ORGANISM="Odontella Sinensis, Strain Grunow 1884" /NCGR_SAMPLE_ID=MMETSP0160_2 /ASSEMBLY_ACC=CAM_ASM_000250 /LENGTH=405 /DNA_ID=CAMNT_0025455825 /DNA_START=13 /DNA_END=1230 /DNA_ORIENTATION=+